MIKDIMFAEKYQKDGQEKTAWKKVGTLFIKEDGKMSIKMDMIPLNSDGWLQCFDPKQKEQKPISEQETDVEPF